MSRATTWRVDEFQLVGFDMDSTPRIECTQEVADAAGCKAEVTAITEAAMRGEIIDYKDMRPIGWYPCRR